MSEFTNLQLHVHCCDMINYLPLSSRGLTGLELDNIVYIRAKKIDIQRMKSWLAASALCSLEISTQSLAKNFVHPDFAISLAQKIIVELAYDFV